MPAKNRQFVLKSSILIGEIFEGGQRVSDGRAMLIGRPNELPVTRLALGVGKRHGSAVRRNRVKRLCREAFRSVRESMPPGWDLILLPRVRDKHTVADLAESLQNLARRLAKSRPQEPPQHG